MLGVLPYVWKKKASPVVTAIGTFTFTPATNTLSFTSTSLGTLTQVDYTITIADAGFPNDGRVIVVRAAGHGAAVDVVSDTGGTPLARLTTAQLTGTGASWSFVAGAANDFVVAGGTVTVSLEVTNGVSTDTEGDI
jgi:hypothetical protein